MILDVFPSYKDKDMVDLLYRYERETCLSLNILVEKYLEKVLYQNGYLTAENEEESLENQENKPLSKMPDNPDNSNDLSENNMRHIHFRKDIKKYHIKKWIHGDPYSFGMYVSRDDAIKVRNFLITKNWDKKYSTKESKLRSKKYIDWIFSEMEKEESND